MFQSGTDAMTPSHGISTAPGQSAGGLGIFFQPSLYSGRTHAMTPSHGMSSSAARSVGVGSQVFRRRYLVYLFKTPAEIGDAVESGVVGNLGDRG